MIKVNHEAPMYHMNMLKQHNDYDFCLPHLLDESKKYEEFFLKSRNEGRYIVMDNSLHELGEPYDTERLLYWLKELSPDEFILPDEWENSTKTLVNAKWWIGILKNVYRGDKVGVVQALTYPEVITTYRNLKDLGCDKIAFSYGSSLYINIYNDPNNEGIKNQIEEELLSELPTVDRINTNSLKKAVGRCIMMYKLHKNGIIKDNDRVHLLGTASPVEFIYHKRFAFIESIDTSNPVMNGLELKIYPTRTSLDTKPLVNLNKAFHNKSFDSKTTNLVRHNVIIFKKFVNKIF